MHHHGHAPPPPPRHLSQLAGIRRCSWRRIKWFQRLRKLRDVYKVDQKRFLLRVSEIIPRSKESRQSALLEKGGNAEMQKSLVIYEESIPCVWFFTHSL